MGFGNKSCRTQNVRGIRRLAVYDMIIRERSHPRIGLIGNPSDGYFGKTVAFTFNNFSATVVLYESPDLRIEPSHRDHSVFSGIEALAADVRRFGYYGGIRLLKGATKKFYDYCTEHDILLHKRNFTLRYQSNIPHLVGLAGSSAIICACMRALMRFYDVLIPPPILANLILSVEIQELGIAAGLQDRVVQAYQGLVSMDFDRKLMESRGYGDYHRLDPRQLPPLYMAYRNDPSEISGIYHGNLRQRFFAGDPAVLAAIEEWKQLTDDFLLALEEHDRQRMAALINRNFDIRRDLAAIQPANLDMVELARSEGASAKFTGSGGAIVGTYEDETMFSHLTAVLSDKNIQIVKPVIATESGMEITPS